MHSLWTRYAYINHNIPMAIHSGYVDFIHFDTKIHISTIIITVTPN